jgi:hypothetical protein
MARVSVLMAVLLAAAVAAVIGAEWPRIAARLGVDARARRARTRRKAKTNLRVVKPPADADEDFIASVERDLANLPTIEEQDHRRRR